MYATEDWSHYDLALGDTNKQRVKPIKSEIPDILADFTRATKSLPAVPSFPRDFAPTEAPQRDQGLGRHELISEAQGQLVGETPPSKDTQTDTNQDDLFAKIMERIIDFVSSSDMTPDAELDISVTSDCETHKIIDMAKPDEQNAANLSSIKDSGKELTKIYKPFANNPKKQARYEAYCEKGVLDRDSDMDQVDDLEREREMEFEQATKLYQPLTGTMRRFTHASQPDDAVNPLSAVARSGAHRGAATAEQRDAAQRGVYGVMTRHEAPWRPDSVVCKRFNVPEPNVTSLETKKEDESFTKEQGKFSGSKSHLDKQVKNNESMQTISKSSDQKVQSTKPITEPLITPFKRITVAEIFLKELESSKNQDKEVTETIEKFDKMDLYKSIFPSDSEEELENEKSESYFVKLPKNFVRYRSPPRGIFANIDFDSLQTYGPKIPDSLKQRLETARSETSNLIDSSSNDFWVDVKDVEAMKSKKKHKKHMCKHKIEKAKYKKKDEREDSFWFKCFTNTLETIKRNQVKVKKFKNREYKRNSRNTTDKKCYWNPSTRDTK